MRRLARQVALDTPTGVDDDWEFVVGVNLFHGARDRTPEEIRGALDLDPHVPLVLCDARDRTSSRDVLLALIDHLMAARPNPAPHPVS